MCIMHSPDLQVERSGNRRPPPPTVARPRSCSKLSEPLASVRVFVEFPPTTRPLETDMRPKPSNVQHLYSRRKFLQQTTAATTAVGLTAVSLTSGADSFGQGTSFVRLGGPLSGQADDPEPLALAHRQLGYRAAYCPAVSLDNRQRIREIERAFSKHDVVIAEVGRWVNLLDPDPVQRKANLQQVTEGLALADEVGARCCVDIAGSYNPDVWYGPHPDNISPRFFDETIENIRKIVDAVKPRRAKFSLEMMGWSLPDSADSYLALIKAADRDAFAVHLDPCNMVNSPRRFYGNTDLLNECFDKLGPYIVSCHAKDLVWDIEMNVHFREVGPGDGQIDYTTYLQRLVQLPQQPPLMLEHLSGAAQYDKARLHLFELGKRIGVNFGV
jgi:sugar phosphate isomerase/epimerase